jgi:hypothetical protein
MGASVDSESSSGEIGQVPAGATDSSGAGRSAQTPKANVATQGAVDLVRRAGGSHAAGYAVGIPMVMRGL